MDKQTQQLVIVALVIYLVTRPKVDVTPAAAKAVSDAAKASDTVDELIKLGTSVVNAFAGLFSGPGDFALTDGSDASDDSGTVVV